MAQNANQILSQILGVCSQINKKLDGSGSSASEKSTNGKAVGDGTGAISGMLGKKNSTEKLKAGSEILGKMLSTLSNFAVLKFNTKRISKTSLVLRKLFDTIIYIGRKEKPINKAMKLFYSLSATLPAMSKFMRAFSILLMSFGISILLIAGSIWAAQKMLKTKNAWETMAVIGVVLLGFVGMFWALSKARKTVRKGAMTTKEMGKALLFLGVGLVGFVGSLLLISAMVGQKPNIGGMAISMGIMVSVIGAMGGVFALLGLVAPFVAKGTKVAIGMAIGMAALGVGVLLFALAAKSLTKLGDSEKIKAVSTSKNGKTTTSLKQRSGFGSMLAAIGPGLGAIGIILISSALLFAALGIPVVAGLVGLGAVVAIGISLALMLIGTSILKVAKISKELGTRQETTEVISGMVGSVLSGLIDGVSSALNPGGKKGLGALGAGLKNTVILWNAIALLTGVSVALSMFAYSMTAFANLSNMRVIESYDAKTGKPKFGPTVNIEGVGKTITKTITQFLDGLLTSTKDLTFKKSRAIKKMGRALTGRRGILSAIIQFADVLKVFAQFGPKGEIGYATMDEKTGEMVTDFVSINDVTNNIVNSFSLFTEGISEKVEGLTNRHKRKLLKLSEALMGKNRSKVGGWFLANKPGLLEPINAFSATLMTYAKWGKNGSMVNPDTNEPISITEITSIIIKSFSDFAKGIFTGVDGFANGYKRKLIQLSEALMGKKRSKLGGWFLSDNPGLLEPINAFSATLMTYAKWGKNGSIINPNTNEPILMTDIVKNIVTAITSFSKQLADQTENVGGVNAKRAAKNMGKFTTMIEKMSELSTEHEALDQTAQSINHLATSISNLSDSLHNLNISKLSAINAAAKSSRNFTTSSSAPATSTILTKDSELVKEIKNLIVVIKQSNGASTDVGLADRIGEKVAAAFKGSMFQFEFANRDSGVLTF